MNFPVTEFYQGTSPIIVNIGNTRDFIVIMNDDASADLKVKVNNIIITLKGGEIFDELLTPFSSFEILTSVPYRIYLRDNPTN